LVTPTYKFDAANRFQLESKDDMRKRINRCRIATAGVAERQLGLGALLVGDHLVDQLRRCADDGKLSLSSSELFKRRRMTPQALRPLIISTTQPVSPFA
jgi:hypothetical protein